MWIVGELLCRHKMFAHFGGHGRGVGGAGGAGTWNWPGCATAKTKEGRLGIYNPCNLN
jgi:hypothetical protein